ncbi:MAG TPA: acetyltransferase [Bacteroidia bacterium]|jgi:sugar O-acyltransferase (sialic acid O-acetyltransferase NeuD family)
MSARIVIIGAGGHARVVCEAVLTQGKYDIAGFVDANIPPGTEVMNGYNVILAQADMHQLKAYADCFVVAIGNNKVRENIYGQMKDILPPATIIHPSATVAGSAEIGAGTVILAKSVISSFCRVGENTIINAGVIVDHDTGIGSNVHLSIGTMVGSNSTVPHGTVTLIGQNINAFSRL